MTYIGIDFGSKRVGVAVSDPDEKIAFPVTVLRNNGTLMEEIIKITQEKNAKKFVLGDSKDYKGEDNEIMKAAAEFKDQIEGRGFRVELEPEFMISVQASRIQGENDMLDASAAAVLLQSFLDKRNNKISDASEIS